MFTDESYIRLYPGYRKIVYASHPPDPATFAVPTTQQRGKGVMVWGCVSCKGKGPLTIFGDTLINSQVYQKTISDNLAQIKRLFGRNFKLMQDNARPHTSQSTRDFFTEKHISLTPWPPTSPDLNPIENIWSILKNNVNKRSPNNLETLKKYIQEEWDNLDDEIVKKTCQSFQRRLGALIASGGRSTRY